MLTLLFTHPDIFVLAFGGIIIAIGLHEAAHCYMADYLGDPTPRLLGRLTLNPLAHLDPLGTLVILLTNFGWGKPSPFDPYNLRSPRRDTALISAAGPAANLAIAVVLAFLYHLPTLQFLQPLLGDFLIPLNVNLALFNLLPIPPLDGSKIFLSPNSYLSRQSSQMGYLLLIVLIATGLVSIILSPLANFVLHFLL